MARKVRDLVRDLTTAGFSEGRGGKGSHRKCTHDKYKGAVTITDGRRCEAISGKTGESAIESIQ